MRRLAVLLAFATARRRVHRLLGSTPPSSRRRGPAPPAFDRAPSNRSRPPPPPGALADAACAIPHQQLLRIWRGTDPERSGQIVFVPQEPNFVGTNFPHSGPWNYLQDVPLFWYGPGIIPALGRVERPVTLADVAPTQARAAGLRRSTRPTGGRSPRSRSPTRRPR